MSVVRNQLQNREMKKPFYNYAGVTIYNGHVLDMLPQLPDESIHCVMTSIPYWGLRDYGLPPQI
ncbi:unnamed protein product, partial [marine sediment metagenome]